VENSVLPTSAFRVDGEKSDPTRASQKLCGILVRKERWALSWRGRGVVAAIVLSILCLVLVSIQPFLAVTDRVGANVLVVEGWVHKYAIRTGAEEFKTGSYQRVFTTGGPVVGLGGYINDYQTAASVGADQLKKAGIPDESIQMVPSRVIGRDRTYSSAVALREWFRENNITIQSINVVTEDAHARRTRLLFQRAFGKRVAVGIIAVPNPDYDPKHWWRYSEGLKDVFSEGIAYIYAKFFFYSEESSRDDKTTRTSRIPR
jgi:uncharacterized SAM-binding protein YcdF (DUF218 family)